MSTYNFDVEMTLDIEEDEGELLIDGYSMPKEIKDAIGGRLSVLIKEVDEAYVTFTCRGYHEPAHLYGPPEDCYPADGDEEREIIDVTIGDFTFTDGDIGFDKLRRLIQDAVDMEDVDYDYHDYDDSEV